MARYAPVVVREGRRRASEIAEFLRRSGVPVVVSGDAVADVYVRPVAGFHGYLIDVYRPEAYRYALRVADARAAAAAELGAVYVIVFEGWYGRLSASEWNKALRGLQAAGARVVVSPSKAWTNLYILAKTKKVAAGRVKPESLRPSAPRGLPPQEKAYYVLSAFGARTAEALLKRFGSIAGLCRATVEEIAEARVGGRRLGEKRAKLIYKVIHEDIRTSTNNDGSTGDQDKKAV